MLKDYSEIHRIMVDELKIRNLQDYTDQLNNPETSPFRVGCITPEMVELLSPDNVNSRDFWHLCHKMFEEDPVCNGTLKVGEGFGRTKRKIIDANRHNTYLSKAVGTLGWAELMMDQVGKGRVLEIGPGYGAFKNIVETRYPYIDYIGFDVCPLIPDVLQTEEDGLMPIEFVNENAGQFDLVYCSNVFQHLSFRQRCIYIAAAHSLLRPHGRIVVNILTQLNGPANGVDGKCYLSHYGQYTPIPTATDFHDMLAAEDFVIHTTSHQQGGLAGFCYAKKKVPFTVG